MARWLVILALVFTPAMASVQNSFPWQDSLQKVGEARLKVLFWNIYDSSLWTSNGQFIALPYSYPLALKITYQRDITRQQLVDATIDQWQYLGIDTSKSDSQQWIAALESMWLDVSRGDNLTYYVDEDQVGYFYSGDRLLGKIDDPAFSAAFLGIWLDPGTSRPNIRRQLIGMN